MNPLILLAALGFGGLATSQSLSQQSDMSQAQLLTCVTTCSDKLNDAIVSGCGVSSADDEAALPCVCSNGNLKDDINSCLSESCGSQGSDALTLFDKLCDVTAPDAVGPINDCVSTCIPQAQASCPDATNGDELLECECGNDTVRNAFDLCMMQTCQDISLNAIFTTNIACANRLLNDAAAPTSSAAASDATGASTPSQDKDNAASSILMQGGAAAIWALVAAGVASAPFL